MDLRTARNVWAAPADCEFQKSLVRGAEVLRRSRGWGPRRPEEVFARRRDLRRPCRWGIFRREDFEVVGRGGDAWRKGSCPALGAAPRHSLAVRRGSVLGGQAWLGPPGSGSIKWARADARRLDKAVLCGAISAASSPTAPEEASHRPRTQDTGNVSHFARNQPGGVRPSSASPPSPHSPCLTGILTVLRHFGSGYVKARSSMVRSGARRQGSRGRSLRDLTSRCSGRGRLRPSVFQGLESRPRS